MKNKIIDKLKNNKLNLVLVVLLGLFLIKNNLDARADLAISEITQAQYDEFQENNIPTFIAFNAKWCPTCRKQNKVLSEITTDYEGKAKIYAIDWDKRKEFDVPAPNQRTTIVYFENREIQDQLIGATNEDVIREFIEKNIK
jgi:thioredoxin 1